MGKPAERRGRKASGLTGNRFPHVSGAASFRSRFRHQLLHALPCCVHCNTRHRREPIPPDPFVEITDLLAEPRAQIGGQPSSWVLILGSCSDDPSRARFARGFELIHIASFCKTYRGLAIARPSWTARTDRARDQPIQVHQYETKTRHTYCEISAFDPDCSQHESFFRFNKTT
jgi:hypothetical protein